MTPVRSDLAKRREDESTLMQARVRQGQRRGVAEPGIVVQQIEIERTRGVLQGTDTAEIGLDRQQHLG